MKKTLKSIAQDLAACAPPPAPETEPIVSPPMSMKEKIRAIETTLFKLINDGTSDAARVAASKALMDLVKYMKGENDDELQQQENAERTEALIEARKFLEDFATLKAEQAVASSLTSVEPSHEMAPRVAAAANNAAE